MIARRFLSLLRSKWWRILFGYLAIALTATFVFVVVWLSVSESGVDPTLALQGTTGVGLVIATLLLGMWVRYWLSRLFDRLLTAPDSADYAGLFKAVGNRTKMVMPLTLPGGTAQLAPPAPAEPPTDTSLGGDGGGGGDGENIDHAILINLLRRLPPGGTPLTGRRRKALIDAFTAMLVYVYPDADSEE